MVTHRKPLPPPPVSSASLFFALSLLRLTAWPARCCRQLLRSADEPVRAAGDQRRRARESVRVPVL